MVDRDDERTLEDVFRLHYARLVRSLAAAAGNADLAADAVQEAFVQAHLHWRRVRRYDDPAGWVRRVAVNGVLNQRRSSSRRRAALDRAAVERPAPEPPYEWPGADPSIAAALASLPLRQRTAFALRFVADLPVADVARPWTSRKARSSPMCTGPRRIWPLRRPPPPSS